MMKTLTTHVLASAGAALILFSPTLAHAKHHDDDHNDHHGHYSHSHSNFTITFGNGYLGRGYYYGPAGAGYYNRAPGVVYYSSRAAIPSRYYVSERVTTYYPGHGTATAIQRALARRGYYHGPIDGDIGPGSRRAISHYQVDHGLAVTGTISSGLLRSLGI